MIKECPKCSNKQVKEEYNYCSNCGVKIETALEVPVQEQQDKIVLQINGETLASIIAK